MAQEVLFENNSHIIYYELTDTNVVITVEDFQNSSFESKALPDSSVMDYILLQFDINNNGIIDNGIDKYYTYNPLLTNNICIGNIESDSKISACNSNTNGKVEATIQRTVKYNTDHLVFQFTIPQSELKNLGNVCSRFTVKLHENGNPIATTTDFPSTSLTNYFITDYFTLPLYPSLDLGADKIFCVGDSLLAPANYPNYLWNNSATTNFILPQDSAAYSLKISDNTCSITDTVVWSLGSDYYCSGIELTFPSIVTPNNDGLNDYFEPLTHSKFNSIDFSKAELSIYNRWGVLVGGKTGLPPFWDCYLDWGQKAPSGTYFYSFNLNGGKTDIINGFFTVIYTER